VMSRIEARIAQVRHGDDRETVVWVHAELVEHVADARAHLELQVTGHPMYA